MKVLGALLILLSLSSKANEIVRVSVIYSQAYSASFHHFSTANNQVLNQIEELNQTLDSQKAGVSLQVVSSDIVVNNSGELPSDLCGGFLGFDMPLFQTEPEPNIANFKNIRIKNKADMVLLMTYTDSIYFKEENNYGVACGTRRAENGMHEEFAFTIVEKNGLETHTISHEIGHFLGASHHKYQRVEDTRATLMIANGNPEGLKRELLFSDIPSKPEVSDIHIIRKNAKLSSQAFERWILLQ